MERFLRLLYTLFCVMTAMLAYNIHHKDEGIAVLSFFFAPIAWCYWVVTHQVSYSVVKHTFDFLLK